MINKNFSIKGINDILPLDTFFWRELESILIYSVSQYGYEEIRLPLIEKTKLFERSIGQVTDIMRKEMYTFIDKNGESLSLRPEGTVGCIRACIENNLISNSRKQRLWYLGPMFRRDKPQKGRYRQFYQFGVEAIGITEFYIELELIFICSRLWKLLGIDNYIKLQINTIGTIEERKKYTNALRNYFKLYIDCLDENSKYQLINNPIRILDSKNIKIQSLLKDAPKLFDFLDYKSKYFFNLFCSRLDYFGIAYFINPLLVRGLDYYNNLVFEWYSEKLGKQITICAGGRYDLLTQYLGRNSIPAIGFSIGMERLILLLKVLKKNFCKKRFTLFFIVVRQENAINQFLLISESLRDFNMEWKVIFSIFNQNLKKQFKKANMSGAEYALIIGKKEAFNKEISIKNLYNSEKQVTLLQKDLIDYLKEKSL
ncbi:histidine--tRNA ligase [Candidatus Legionella polyplacis]|uniref:Histidine--tRNA ligase n=1 Tax=Candidatus Legionella polyplacis TaxID=2005262 RepID=A0ABZ2GXQ7_9GAMM|nr:histidine--tRNA ligase [Candidatus Legionella polyplacis]ATW02058.1 histidine--tRNA ligase [Candidatus Legionella polyplacis]